MASLIVDGIHLPDEMVRDFIRWKGIDQTLLTTDAMAGASAPPGRYTLGDLWVEVDQDGRTQVVGTSRIAGSTVTMELAVNHLLRMTNVDLSQAIQMSAYNGWKLFPELKRQIQPGDPADLVLFDAQEKLTIRSVWIDGEKN